MSYHGALSDFKLNDLELNELFDCDILLSRSFQSAMIDGTPLCELFENAQSREC